MAVSVDYTVSGGTAIAGEDFSATGGTLEWAANDTSPKTITVQVASDGVVEGDESFQVTLQSTSSNATLGSQSVATVTISNVAALSCDTELPLGSISQDTVLDLPCYRINGDISVAAPANLTIQPGVTLKFASGADLNIRQGASLTADGTADRPIVFTGQEALPGFWSGIVFQYSNSGWNSLSHAILEYGGIGSHESMLMTQSTRSSPTRLAVSNVIMRHSESAGFDFDGDTILTSFDNNTVTLNGSVGTVSMPAADAITIGNSLSGNTDDRIYIDNGNIDVDESVVLANLGIPWSARLLSVEGSLTVASGTDVVFRSQGQLIVRGTGTLTATGTTDAPILLRGDEATAGYWHGVMFQYSNSGGNTLGHVRISDAGGSQNGDTALYLQSTVSSPTVVSIDNLQLTNSQGYGFNMLAGTRLSAFNTVSSSGNASPGMVHASLVGSLGTGLAFTGNTEDMLSVSAGTIETDTTWQDHGVPYLSASLSIEAPWTVVPGVALLMDNSAEIIVRTDGSINAVGTAASPILISGAVAQAGYWDGIRIQYANSPQNVFDHATVEYGGVSSSAGNFKLDCTASSPTQLSLSNTTIANSAAWGIYLSTSGCTVNLDDTTVTFSNNALGDTNI